MKNRESIFKIRPKIQNTNTQKANNIRPLERQMKISQQISQPQIRKKSPQS